MKKEYDLKKLRPLKRGAVVSKSAKVAKTIRLDLDVVEWLVIEADRRGNKYQTLINALLRTAMQNEGTVLTTDHVREIVREELKKRVS